jgi:hypothetical protein
MAQRLKTQWKYMKHIYKPIIYFFILSLWLCWDIYQAHSNSAGVYKSFFNASSITSTGPATVSIVRSNDPLLAHPCGVTSEEITYTTIAEMVQRAVDLAGGLSSIIHTGDTVLIKPNIVQQDSTGSGGVTDVRVVKALVYMVDAIDHGHIKIIVADGSARPLTNF